GTTVPLCKIQKNLPFGTIRNRQVISAALSDDAGCAEVSDWGWTTYAAVPLLCSGNRVLHLPGSKAMQSAGEQRDRTPPRLKSPPRSKARSTPSTALAIQDAIRQRSRIA